MKKQNAQSRIKPDFDRIYEEGQDKSACTFDTPELFRHKKHLVLIYDQKMEGFPEYEELKYCSKWCGQAYTQSLNYVLHRRNAGSASYPVALRSGFSPERSAIRGDLFAVDPEILMELDDVYGNGLHYMRTKVPIVVPFRFENQAGFKSDWKYVSDLTAWFYSGTDSFRELIRVEEPGAWTTCSRLVFSDTHKSMYAFTAQDLK